MDNLEATAARIVVAVLSCSSISFLGLFAVHPLNARDIMSNFDLTLPMVSQEVVEHRPFVPIETEAVADGTEHHSMNQKNSGLVIRAFHGETHDLNVSDGHHILHVEADSGPGELAEARDDNAFLYSY